jgi:hypothetical protein
MPRGVAKGLWHLTYTTAIFSILCRNKQQEKLVSNVTQKHQGRPRPKSSCECQGGPGWSRLNLRFASFSLEHWGCTPNLRSANRIQPRVPSLTLHKCAENWWLFLLCLTLVLTKLHLAEMLQIFYFVDPVLLQFVAEIWIFLLVGHWNWNLDVGTEWMDKFGSLSGFRPLFLLRCSDSLLGKGWYSLKPQAPTCHHHHAPISQWICLQPPSRTTEAAITPDTTRGLKPLVWHLSWHALSFGWALLNWVWLKSNWFF